MRREIDDLDTLERWLDAGESLDDTVLDGLDLERGRGGELARRISEVGVDGAVVLGCRLPTWLQCDLTERGAVVFPPIVGIPYQPYRARLYTPEELFDGFDPDDPCTYCRTPDARIYAHWQATGRGAPSTVIESLARRLHDQSVTDELQAFLRSLDDSARVVAVMGGHSLPRSHPDYRKVARIAHRLARRGYLLVSGGGPGAMEATNLGAWLAAADDEAVVDAAVDELAAAGADTYRHREWLAAAVRLRRRLAAELPGDPPAGGHRNLGIPTWLYGHEPPNPFPTHVAKYFANSVREEGLITVARGGIVFAPGDAGTIQEVFQDAAQNRYATTGEVSPMVFLDGDYWTRAKPVYPLLAGLAESHQYGRLLTLCDHEDEVVDFLLAHPPEEGDVAPWSFCGEYC